MESHVGNFMINLIKGHNLGISSMVVDKAESLESCWTEGWGCSVAVGRGALGAGMWASLQAAPPMAAYFIRAGE